MALIDVKQITGALRQDGTNSPTANINWGGFAITNLLDPVNPQDAATKFYVDSLIMGLSWKNPVRAATTVAGTLATSFENGDTIDGVLLVTNDRILIKDQATASENGLYKVNAAGAPTRTTDADSAAELLNAAVFVEEGTVNADRAFVGTANAPIVVGTTALPFVQFSSASSIVDGAGLLFTGTTLAVELAATPGLEFDAVGDAGKLRVLVDPTGGIERVAAGIGVKLDGDSLSKSASGLKAVVPTTNNKYMTSAATNADFQTSGNAITSTPGGDGYVNVFVNGARQHLGNAVKTRDCYFSSDGGTTAKAIGSIVAADTLYWVGSVAGFQLAVTDKLDFEYEA